MENTHDQTQRFVASLLTFLVGMASLSIAHQSFAQDESAAEQLPTTPTLSREAFQRRSIEKQWEVRQQRTQEFRRALSQSSDTLKGLHIQRRKQVLLRDNNRIKCTDELRRASKFTKFTVTLDCYRDELQHGMEILERERNEIMIAPGVSDDVRSIALTRLDLLADAMSVIVNAIDSGVYENIEEIKEAKRSLRENYREPYWLARTRVRSDILLTWTANLMTRIVDTGESVELTEEEQQDFFVALECMEEAEQQLQTVGTAQSIEIAQSLLLQVHALMTDCTSDVRSAYIDRQQKRMKAERKAAEEAAAEAAEEKRQQEALLGRRLRRRLQDEYRVQGAHEHVEEVEEEEVIEEEVHAAPPPEPVAEPPLSRRLRRRLGEGYPVVGEQ